MSFPNYRYDLYRNGVKQAELTEVKALRYGYARNRFFMGSFTHNMNNIDSTVRDNLVTGSQVYIYRKGFFDNNLKLVYIGEIQRVTRSITSDNAKQSSVGLRPIPLALLSKRYITKTYTTEQEENIAWDLINEANTDTYFGAFTTAQVATGITQGTLNATSNQRSLIYTHDNILESLQELVELADVSPNPQRVRGFRIAPDLITPTPLLFSYEANYGEDRSNSVIYTNETIDTITATDDISRYGNRVYVLGQGSTNEVVNSTNATQLNELKMREKVVSLNNTSDSTRLIDFGTNILNIQENQNTIYEINTVANDPFIGTYREGDRIRIKFIDDYISLDDVFRVESIQVSLSQDNKENAQIKISKEKPLVENITVAGKIAEFLENTDRRLFNLEN